MNKQLATDEGQADLFTADLENYKDGLLGELPYAVGILSYEGDELTGFAITNYKFATYRGFPTLYIEDIYLKKKFENDENKREFLTYIIEEAKSQNCVRVEMRVLNTVNWGVELLNDLGLSRIDKWSVYRLSV